MDRQDSLAGDPFADPSPHDAALELTVDATLSVGRDASLTLATDSLIVLGWASSCPCF